ncbi:GDSL-type esterase/lipase family protein [Limosilactobacillus gorillae]|uniref:GDSL-type esterase/lipase family protein n=1 Tax=Limosilactobacillus gorillae TaxID=1450649 RepID=UPI000A700B0D|nr:GDSL-type esterase/lipase family protein [Limosilactobacillus gorillae]
MTTLFTPAQVAQASLLLGRWRLQDGELYTPLLGGVIKTIIQGAQALTLTVANRHAELMPSHYWAIRVNHGTWQRFNAAQKITLPIPVPDCLVEIMTAGNTDFDDVWTGRQGFALTSLKLTGAGWLVRPVSRPVVTILGDSITAGCWVNGYHAAVDYCPENNFVGLAQDQVDFDLVRVAYSAAGLLRPATGGVPVAIDWLNHFNAQTPWPTQGNTLTVINLGVNDRRFEEDAFATAYEDYVTAVIKRSQGPTVLMIPFAQTFSAIIRDCARHHGLPVIETAGWCTSFTDGLHPDLAGSRTAARRFATALTRLLNERSG